MKKGDKIDKEDALKAAKGKIGENPVTKEKSKHIKEENDGDIAKQIKGYYSIGEYPMGRGSMIKEMNCLIAGIIHVQK